jgi:hypothetical protein
MKLWETALAAFLLFAVTTASAAQEVLSRPQTAPSENCVACFAYLEFSSPSLEPEAYAMRGQTPEPSTSSPATDEPSSRLTKQTAALLGASKP